MSLLSHGRSGLLWAAGGCDGRSGSLWGKAGAAQTMVKSDAPTIVVMVVVVVLPVITIILRVRHGASNSQRPRSRHVFSPPVRQPAAARSTPNAAATHTIRKHGLRTYK